jgi:hypothetical protein
LFGQEIKGRIRQSMELHPACASLKKGRQQTVGHGAPVEIHRHPEPYWFFVKKVDSKAVLINVLISAHLPSVKFVYEKIAAF